jgi:hypothetical protein
MMSGFGFYVLGWFLVAGLILTPVVVVTYYADKHSCHVKTQDIGDYDYSLFAGCLVRPKGTDAFIPLANYRVL